MTQEEALVLDLHERLGIPENYRLRTGLQLQTTPSDLVEIGPDVFGRQQRLRRCAASSWFRMQKAAALADIELLVVSAYRSIEYQVELIQRKLDIGLAIEEILTIVAAPGFSEHQGGCALDITTPGCEPVERQFEDSAAFEWLSKSAVQFGFSLSYPPDNPYQVVYEPWHWCYGASD